MNTARQDIFCETWNSRRDVGIVKKFGKQNLEKEKPGRNLFIIEDTTSKRSEDVTENLIRSECLNCWFVLARQLFGRLKLVHMLVKAIFPAWMKEGRMLLVRRFHEDKR
jgi:hypothetical protein